MTGAVGVWDGCARFYAIGDARVRRGSAIRLGESSDTARENAHSGIVALAVGRAERRARP